MNSSQAFYDQICVDLSQCVAWYFASSRLHNYSMFRPGAFFWDQGILRRSFLSIVIRIISHDLCLYNRVFWCFCCDPLFSNSYCQSSVIQWVLLHGFNVTMATDQVRWENSVTMLLLLFQTLMPRYLNYDWKNNGRTMFPELYHSSITTTGQGPE